jgi:hypothetical protein
VQHVIFEFEKYLLKKSPIPVKMDYEQFTEHCTTCFKSFLRNNGSRFKVPLETTNDLWGFLNVFIGKVFDVFIGPYQMSPLFKNDITLTRKELMRRCDRVSRAAYHLINKGSNGRKTVPFRVWSSHMWIWKKATSFRMVPSRRPRVVA